MNLTKFDNSRKLDLLKTFNDWYKNLGNCFDCEKLFYDGNSALALKKF